MIYKIVSISILLILTNTLCAQVLPLPAEKQKEPIALIGGTIHTATGQVIENGAIAFDKGKITFVGKASDFDSTKIQSKIIDITGKQVYPGLILAGSTLGLIEIEQIRATLDNAEKGDFNPNVRSIVAYNTDSHIIPTFRSNGILVAQIAPTDGFFSGTSSIVQLDAWNWEDAALKTDDAIHLQWPQQYAVRQGFSDVNFQENKNYKEQIEKVEKILADAKAWNENPKHEQPNLILQSMAGLYDGSKTLFIHVDINRDIIRSVLLAQKYKVKKIVVAGGNDTWQVKDFLKENNIPVLLDRVHESSFRTHEDVDLQYKLPTLLWKEGIKVAISYADEMGPRSRNLAFNAGTAAAYGLNKEEALQLITKNVAEILGIADRLGTLETGKDAMIVVSDGDLLDMRTNNITIAFIQGRQIDLTNKNKELYERFRVKYGRRE